MIINKLENKKSPGIDKIPNLQIKNIPVKIVAQLLYIFNYCLTISYFPKIWKLAKILPLPKPGKDKLFPQNYRLISLLISLAEIFEKLIADKINHFLTHNNIINEAQFGFRPGKCTVRQLARVVYSILSNFNKNNHTSSIFLDIEKAFDTVCHKALLYK